MARAQDNLELVVFGWLDAVRAREPARVADRLAPGVTWLGLRPDLRCDGRAEVRRNIAGGPELRGRVEGLELRAQGNRVLLTLRLPGVSDLVGVPVAGELFQVFTVGDGVILKIEDFAAREAAVDALLDDPAPLPPRSPEAPSPGPVVSGAPPVGKAAVADCVPFVFVADVARSCAFYGLLGFTFRDTHRHAGRLDWAWLENADARVMLARAAAPVDPAAQAVLLYLYTEDLHALRAHLLAHGLAPGPIVDGSPGPVEEMRLDDPDGWRLMIARRSGR